MSDDRIVFGFVHMGRVHERFMRSMIGAFSHDQGKHLTRFISSSPANIAEARNNVVEQFLDGEGDWLWFVDTDIAFPPDTHLQLLEAADPVERPIMSAAYWSEYGDGLNLVWQVMSEDDGGLYPIGRLPDQKVTRLATIGMGCVLIHRSVFERIAVEFEADPWTWFSHEIAITRGERKRLGEDITFCVRALKLDIPVHGLNLEVEHRKETTLGEIKEMVVA